MRIGIIGAGITGLTAAYELGKRGHQATVYESEAIAGGLSSGFHIPEWEWPLDRFYRHIFAGDRAIISLAQELEAKLLFSRPVTSIWVNERPYPYDSPVAVALRPGLPLHVNLRAGIVIAYLKYLVRQGTNLEHTTAHAWMKRALGEQAYRVLWEPMLRGKFKDNYDKVNMAWFWARFVARTPRLGYFEGGFQAFINRLVVAVRKQGGMVHLETPVSEVSESKGGITFALADGTTASYDRALTTASPDKLRAMVPSMPEDYTRDVQNLKSTGTVVLILALKDSILTDGTYWLNLPQPEFPCLSMVEHTNYQDKSHYAGDTIVYLGDYLPLDAPQMSMSTRELYAAYREALVRVRPEFQDDWVRAMWSFREDYAQPVPEVDHSQRVPRIENPVLPNLYWACMHHVHPWDRGTNYAVDLGQRVAQVIAD